MNSPVTDTITCPCGNRFELTSADQIRGYGGNWFNKDVERHSFDAPHEVQCPKCLLWFDWVTGEINLK